jgi:phage terminase large subunit GpA-like protein
VKTALEVLRAGLDGAMSPRVRRGVAEWADEHRQIVVGERKGRWSTDAAPYLRGPMQAWTDPRVRQITIVSATQMGKTESLYNCIFFTIDEDPQDMLFVYPTDEDARFNNRRRFLPTVEQTPRIKRWLSDAARDTAAGEIHFRRMTMRWVGSNSGSSLESFPYGRAAIDELDRCDEEVVARVRQRLKTFADSKLLVTSTPTMVGTGIDAQYNGTTSVDEAFAAEDEGRDGARVHGTPPSDRRRFVVPCPHCGIFHLRAFSLVRWEGGRGAAAKVVRHGAWMECPGCKGRIEAGVNLWQLRRGLWAPVPADAAGSSNTVHMPTRLTWPGQESGVMGPDAEQEGVVGGEFTCDERLLRFGEHVGFALHGLCSSLVAGGNPYGYAAAEWIAGGCVPTRAWCNDTLGEPWVIKGEAADVKGLLARAGGYGMGEVPAEVLAITVGCDVQQDRIFAEVLGWGERGGVCWMIEAHEIPRTRGRNLVELDELARKTWKRADGKVLQANVMAVDSGKFTDEVYRFAMRYPVGARAGEGPRRVWAVKGELGQTWPMPWRESKVEARADRAASMIGEGLPLLIVNTSYWKEHILARLAGRVEGTAMDAMDDWRFPAGVPKAYLMQLTAEQLVRDRKGGRVVASWVLRPGRTANHFLDCRVYGCAAADREGVRQLVRVAEAAKATAAKRAADASPGGGSRDGGRESLMARARDRRR